MIYDGPRGPKGPRVRIPWPRFAARSFFFSEGSDLIHGNNHRKIDDFHGKIVNHRWFIMIESNRWCLSIFIYFQNHPILIQLSSFSTWVETGWRFQSPGGKFPEIDIAWIPFERLSARTDTFFQRKMRLPEQRILSDGRCTSQCSFIQFPDSSFISASHQFIAMFLRRISTEWFFLLHGCYGTESFLVL